ncbi:MAG TPA: hypothetical protein VGP47_08435 [Parachlamydiaceae bacterium]|nr:hypothetical protein [Parachlamydiaceae bacterium]
MSNYILFFIPAYSILIACATFFSLALYFSSLKKKELLEKIMEAFIPKIGQSILNAEPGAEIEAQIDSRLTDIITGFKKQIPMVSMFLSKSKEAELKETARTELMKLIPSIKQHFSGKIDQVIEAGGLNQKVEKLIEGLWKHIRYRFLLVAFLVGLIMGVIEVGLLLYFF